VSYRSVRQTAIGLGATDTMTSTADLPAASQLGRIRSQGGRSYQITPDDLLWLARSVRYEGGNKPATAWTYAQRLVLFNNPNLMRLVQGHSQPVNPIWRRDGEKCRPGGPYHGDQRYCSEAQLARRDEASTIPWSRLPQDVRDTIVGWAQGRVPDPVPRATDFADASVSTQFLLRHPDAAVVSRDGNWYLSEGASSAPGQGSRAWPRDYVTIEYNGQSAGPATGAGLFNIPGWALWVGIASGAALLVGGAIAGGVVWRRRRVKPNRRRVSRR